MKTKECPSCAMEIDMHSNECPICGYEFPQTSIWLKVMVVLLTILIIYYLIF
ncbi:MAG: zinc ribbon domain-containing protein [Bacteroidota bacterium]